MHSILLSFLPFFAMLFPLGIVATEGGPATEPETDDNDDPAKEEKPAAKAPNRIARALAVAGGKDDPLVAANALLTLRCESAEQAATAARLKITDLETLLTAAASENTKLEEKSTALNTVLAAALNLSGEVTADALKSALDKKISSEVAADLAKTGTPGAKLPPASQTEDGEPNLRALSGMERVRAAFASAWGTITR